VYHHSFFLRFLLVTSHPPSRHSNFSSSRGVHSLSASTAPSLRLPAPSGSLLRCQQIKVYHHYIQFFFRFPTTVVKLPRMAGGPTYPSLLMLTLLVGSPSVLEKADLSTMSSPSSSATCWTSPLFASQTPVRWSFRESR
jgi:hypothetical protein